MFVCVYACVSVLFFFGSERERKRKRESGWARELVS